MSTHNIGFYEDLTKIIFELSSKIIKYAPYFFCWLLLCLAFQGLSYFKTVACLCSQAGWFKSLLLTKKQ